MHILLKFTIVAFIFCFGVVLLLYMNEFANAKEYHAQRYQRCMDNTELNMQRQGRELSQEANACIDKGGCFDTCAPCGAASTLSKWPSYNYFKTTHMKCFMAVCYSQCILPP